MIRQLKETMQIERTQMRLRLVLPSKDAKRVQEKLKPLLSSVESEEWDSDLEMVRYWVIVKVWKKPQPP